jgi:RND family efflux transporter MFP subunit
LRGPGKTTDTEKKMRVLNKLTSVLRLLPKLLGVVALILIILWMSYGFHSRVAPGEAEYDRPMLGDRPVAVVRLLQTTETIGAVGTVRPRHKSEIASQLLATILEVAVNAGDHVTAGQHLVTLDDREIQAQLGEAEAAVAAVSADLAVRDNDYRRYQRMLADRAVTKEDYDRVEGAFQVTQAQLTRAQQQVERILVMLTYTNIKAPEAGIVSDRFADPGDLAAPGKPLLAIHDPTQLELNANVREGLAAHLQLGRELRVRVDAVHIDGLGTVREIVPQAEADSRSVLVKVTLPKQPLPDDVKDQLYIGMFGRLEIPVRQLERVVVAADAVQQIGQLDVVDVVAENDSLERRYVRVGQRFGNEIEILSGLRVGERVALPADDVSHRSAANLPIRVPAFTRPGQPRELNLQVGRARLPVLLATGKSARPTNGRSPKPALPRPQAERHG